MLHKQNNPVTKDSWNSERHLSHPSTSHACNIVTNACYSDVRPT